MFSKTELTLPTESDTYRIITCEILKRERIRCLFAGASGMVLCQLRVFMHYLPEMEFCHFSGSASCFAPSLFFSALQFFEGVVPFCSRYKMFFELLKFLVIHQIHAKLFHAHEKHVTLIRNMDKSSFSKLSSFCDC